MAQALCGGLSQSGDGEVVADVSGVDGCRCLGAGVEMEVDEGGVEGGELLRQVEGHVAHGTGLIDESELVG